MKAVWGKVEVSGSGHRRAGSPQRCAKGGAVMGLLIIGTLLFQPLLASAQSDEDVEYRLKLAYLYNFAQFVNWPLEAFRGPGAPLTMCVAGRDPFQGEIEQGLRGRSVGGHPIEIRKLKTNDDPRGCHIIFVPAGDKKLSARILAAVRGSSTLTVGETKDFAATGGVINLTLSENKLRFEINLDAATQTRLKISSKLLALATIVKTQP
jgi:hypothetical protein